MAIAVERSTEQPPSPTWPEARLIPFPAPGVLLHPRALEALLLAFRGTAGTRR